MVKKGLGKGIGALLSVAADDRKSYFICPIESIKPCPGQPRKTFRPEKLQELADSIRAKGIIQPLVVRQRDGFYELIAGERRWRAAQKAGLHDVPVVVKDVADEAALEMALIENIQREDLNAIEEASAYQTLMDQFSITQEEVARRVGKERSTVTNFLRLLRLPDDIKIDVSEERLSMGHARALLSLEEAGQMRVARDKVVKEALSVRGTENLVKRLKLSPTKKLKEKTKDLHLADIENRLRKKLGAKVNIKSRSRGGMIEISYSGSEELSRIMDLLIE